MANNGGVYSWSTTAANNSNADLTVNWQPQMAPSAVAPSGRAMMASVAKWRDDISGALVTTGMSTAYSVASNQNFDSASDLNNKIVAFTPNVTSGASPTLTVDGIGPYPIQSAPNANLPAGVLVQGTPYVVIFNQASNAFYLQSSFFNSNPYNIPIGASVDWWTTSPPNSSFVFPYGQAISRTVYSALFTLWGTFYGTGDGSTTFNVPDVRGRVMACPDTMGGTDAGRLSGSTIANRGLIGSVGGEATNQLATANLPPYTPSGSVSNGSTSIPYTNSSVSITGGGSTIAYGLGSTALTVSGMGFSGNPQGGSSQPFDNVQPTILACRILRII